jgi:hypothetical protein
MPWVEFEPTILSFEQAKTVHATDGAATVIGERKCTHGLLRKKGKKEKLGLRIIRQLLRC